MSATDISNSCVDPGDPRVARSRAKLLAAATELLVEAGPRSVTVDAVAERSGVAKSTLYRHWTSRNALLVDVVRANVPSFTEPDPSLGFEDALRALMHDAASALSVPGAARILPALLTLQAQMPDLAELVADDHECKADVVRSVLARGVAEGRLPPEVDPHCASHLLFGPLMLAVVSGQVADPHELADYVVDRFVRSYASEGDAAGPTPA